VEHTIADITAVSQARSPICEVKKQTEIILKSEKSCPILCVQIRTLFNETTFAFVKRQTQVGSDLSARIFVFHGFFMFFRWFSYVFSGTNKTPLRTAAAVLNPWLPHRNNWGYDDQTKKSTHAKKTCRKIRSGNKNPSFRVHVPTKKTFAGRKKNKRKDIFVFNKYLASRPHPSVGSPIQLRPFFAWGVGEKIPATNANVSFLLF